MDATRQIVCRHCGRNFAVSPAMLGQQIVCPHCRQATILAAPAEKELDLSGREVYNMVTDLGSGVNIRWSDNLLQLAAAAVGLLVGALLGALLVRGHRLEGAIGVGIVGAIVAVFGTGIYLMIYRFIRHLRGRHD
jgi:hypothetical protein